MRTFFYRKPCKPPKVDTSNEYLYNVLSEKSILINLEKTKEQLEVAYSGFDNVLDFDLIDCHIYQINALMKRYKHLMRLVSEIKPHAKDRPLTLKERLRRYKKVESLT